MKYLKKFNDNLSSKEKALEIKEDCESYLSYLLDEIDIKVDVNLFDTDGNYQFALYTESPNINLKWNDIKDTFIPFIQMFRNSYNIVSPHSFSLPNYTPPYISFITLKNIDINTKIQGPTLTYTVDSVINDNIDLTINNGGVTEEVEIRMIYFFFKRK